MRAAQRTRLDEEVRTYLYRALTNASPSTLAAWREGLLSRWPMKAAEWFARRGPIRVAEGPARGLLLSGRHLPITHVQGFGLARGLLELPVQEALRRTVAPGSVVYDIGSNVGFFALLAARLAGPSGRVEAFEPIPSSALSIRENASLNGFRNVKVHHVAVGQASGPAELVQVAERSQSHLRDRGWHPSTEAVLTTDVVSIDEVIACGTHPIPRVMKIDVEGSEIAVLEGARDTLRRHAPILICELHETNREVADLLADQGYRLENLEGSGPVVEAGPSHLLGWPPS